jgi:hypothetical protein
MTVSENLTDAHLECPLFTFSLPLIPITSALPARQVCRPVDSAGKISGWRGARTCGIQEGTHCCFPANHEPIHWNMGPKGAIAKHFSAKKVEWHTLLPPK